MTTINLTDREKDGLEEVFSILSIETQNSSSIFKHFSNFIRKLLNTILWTSIKTLNISFKTTYFNIQNRYNIKVESYILKKIIKKNSIYPWQI